MTKRTEKPGGTQGANEARGALAEVLAPLVAGMTATRARLLAWVHAQGVVALRDVCAAEAAGLAGPKGKHHAERTHHHWWITATELTLGGRRIQLARRGE